MPRSSHLATTAAPAARTYVWAYGCVSSAGAHSRALWQSLVTGTDHSQKISTQDWPVPCTFQPQAYTFSKSWGASAGDRLNATLLAAWAETLDSLSTDEQSQLQNSARLGVIFASTKGNIEDFIWQKSAAVPAVDPVASVLDQFLASAHLSQVQRHNTACVSNACASTLAAIYLAQQWMQQGRVDAVLVLAADLVGPFVLQGFQSLRALCPETLRPFAADRSGLRIGEAAVALLLSQQAPNPQPPSSTAQVKIKAQLSLSAVGLDSEGVSLTRPSQNGDSLKRACLNIPGLLETPFDLILAHGTGTLINDLTEDRAFTSLFENSTLPQNKQIPITCTKWSVGHTLGASAGIDLIAAFKTLELQKTFCMANTSQIDPQFRGRYLSAQKQNNLPQKFRNILISSLGFGGVHAATIASIDA